MSPRFLFSHMCGGAGQDLGYTSFVTSCHTPGCQSNTGDGFVYRATCMYLFALLRPPRQHMVILHHLQWMPRTGGVYMAQWLEPPGATPSLGSLSSWLVRREHLQSPALLLLLPEPQTHRRRRNHSFLHGGNIDQPAVQRHHRNRRN